MGQVAPAQVVPALVNSLPEIYVETEHVRRVGRAIRIFYQTRQPQNKDLAGVNVTGCRKKEKHGLSFSRSRRLPPVRRLSVARVAYNETASLSE